MKSQTEQLSEQRLDAMTTLEMCAKPPPAGSLRPELFQSFEELRVRDCHPPSAKERVIHCVGAIVLGSVMFAILLLAMYVLE